MSATTHPEKTPRPLSLSVVGWWLIVTGAISIYGLTAALSSVGQSTWASLGISPFVGVTITLLSGAAHVAAGIGILRGELWGRMIYLAFGLASIVVSGVVFRTALPLVLIGLLVYGLFAFFLTREPAKAFFEGTYKLPPADRERRRIIASLRAEQRNQSDLKRLFGVLIAVGAGFLISMALLMIGMAEGGMAGFAVAALVAAFFGLGALIALAIGAVLWGRTRWAGLCGWTLAATGAWSAFSGLTMAVITRPTIWESVMAQPGTGAEIDIGVFTGGFTTMGALGLVVGLAGGALLYRQHEADQKAANLALGEDKSS